MLKIIENYPIFTYNCVDNLQFPNSDKFLNFKIGDNYRIYKKVFSYNFNFFLGI